MIIVKGTLNVVVLTLDEKKTSACDWLLEFINEMTGESKAISVTDQSAYPSRYNMFQITEGTDITLDPSQTWRYKAHQMAVGDNDLNNSIKVCETGICKVIDPQENEVVTFDEADEKDTPAFDN